MCVFVFHTCWCILPGFVVKESIHTAWTAVSSKSVLLSCLICACLKSVILVFGRLLLGSVTYWWSMQKSSGRYSWWTWKRYWRCSNRIHGTASLSSNCLMITLGQMVCSYIIKHYMYNCYNHASLIGCNIIGSTSNSDFVYIADSLDLKVSRYQNHSTSQSKTPR